MLLGVRLGGGGCWVSVGLFVFFFKQKTAYEVLRSVVGSGMCISDRRLHLQLKREKWGRRKRKVDKI